MSKQLTSGTLLFKKVKQCDTNGIFYAFFGEPPPQKEEKEVLAFIGEVKTPQELTAFVRQDPLSKYVLIKGQMVDVSVSIPVFVDGKNIEVHNEWI